MKKILTILSLLSIMVKAEKLIEYDYEADIYYSNISAYLDLDSDRNITDGSRLSETELYKDLFLKSFSPNVFLVEASVHPMNYLGMAFRDQNEQLYTPDKRQDFNFVKAMTAGFEEPYSLSFFLGRMMVFKKNNTDRPGNNRAYMGYLLTIGDQSIKDNQTHPDKWLNFEIKLKGTRDKKESDLDWSFRLGARLHGNPDFVDAVYLGARRKRIDYNKGFFSFIYNVAYSSLVAVSINSFEITEGTFIIDKIYPTGYKSLSFGMGIGYLYTSKNKYLGALRDAGVDRHRVIFRPNFKYKF